MMRREFYKLMIFNCFVRSYQTVKRINIIQINKAILSCIAMVLIVSCSLMGSQTKGTSGPVAWEATDLRLIKRTIGGYKEDLYAFTLVLKEIHGTSITFTNRELTVWDVDIGARTSNVKGTWKLKPYGELRIPFSSYRTGEIFFTLPSTWTPRWRIIFTGTNSKGEDIRVDIVARLPRSPKQFDLLKNESLNISTPEALDSPTDIPVQIVNNIILIPVILNDKERASFILDTGATRTMMTRDIAGNLGIIPKEDAPKLTLSLIAGKEVEVPFVKLDSIQVGDAMVRDLWIGVSEIHPGASMVDGLLGGDFLEHFKITVDRHMSRVRLEAQSPSKAENIFPRPAWTKAGAPLYRQARTSSQVKEILPAKTPLIIQKAVYNWYYVAYLGPKDNESGKGWIEASRVTEEAPDSPIN